jgi:hypothetical protein
MRGRGGARQLRLEPGPLRLAQHVARVALRVTQHHRQPARQCEPVGLERDPVLGVVAPGEEQGRVVAQGAHVQKEDLHLLVPLPEYVRRVQPLPPPPGVVLRHVPQKVEVRRLPARGVILWM